MLAVVGRGATEEECWFGSGSLVSEFGAVAVAVVVSVAVVAIAAGIFRPVASVRILLSPSAAWASLSGSREGVAAVGVIDRVPALSSNLWLASTAFGTAPASASASGAAWAAVVELDVLVELVASGTSPAEGSWMHVTSEASALLLGCSSPGVPGTSGGGDMHVDPA